MVHLSTLQYMGCWDEIKSSINFDLLPRANSYFAFVMVNKNKLHIQSEDPFKTLWLIKYKFWQMNILFFLMWEEEIQGRMKHCKYKYLHYTAFFE